MCTELCPRHLIGHELPPHLIVRSVSYGHIASLSSVTAALTCSECGVCEAWSCPVEISPMRINQLLKAELRANGVRYQGELGPVSPMAEYRLLPVKRLVARLGLTPFMHKAPMQETAWQPERVELMLNQHIGAPASPCVEIGQRVTQGECIAQMQDGALGAALHASISGVVNQVGSRSITLVRE